MHKSNWLSKLKIFDLWKKHESKNCIINLMKYLHNKDCKCFRNRISFKTNQNLFIEQRSWATVHDLHLINFQWISDLFIASDYHKGNLSSLHDIHLSHSAYGNWEGQQTTFITSYLHFERVKCFATKFPCWS